MTGAANFTPGPWQIKSDYIAEDRRTVIANVDGEYIEGRAHCTFDTIACCSDDYGEHLDEADANARLIAAAPSLYAALKTLCETPASELQTKEPWRKAWDALSKAEIGL